MEDTKRPFVHAFGIVSRCGYLATLRCSRSSSEAEGSRSNFWSSGADAEMQANCDAGGCSCTVGIVLRMEPCACSSPARLV
jgi:hypothetical protein